MKKLVYLGLLLLLTATTALQATAQWTTLTNVNTLVSTATSSDIKSIGTVEGKTWVVYWNEIGTPNYYEVRAQLLDQCGDTLLGPQGILVNNTVPMSSYTTIWSITTDENGNLYVGFNGTGTGTQVFAHKISLTGAQLWGTQGLILGSGYDVKILPLRNGSAIVSWLPANQGVFQKIDSTGTIAWTTPITIQPGVTGHYSSAGEMAELSNGDFVMLIHDRSGYSPSSLFYAQRYTQSGVAVWTAPVNIASSYTYYNKRFDIAIDVDTVYLGFTGSIGMAFFSYLQRINPNGILPWGINGNNFSTQSTYYERDTRMAYQVGSPYVWMICEYTPTSQGSMGEYVQKFNKSTGARLLTNNAQMIFAPGPNDNSHKGELQLLNDQPLFVYSNGTNNSANPITLRGTYLNQAGTFAWPYQYADIATYSTTFKSRVNFTKPDNNGMSVCVWVEDRGNGSKIYAQNLVPCIPPIAGFTTTITGKTVTFYSNPSTADTVIWDFGDGGTGGGFNPIHSYIDTGTYSVCQIVENSCGTDTICLPVHVLCNVAVADFTFTANGLTIDFHNLSHFADHVLWDFGDGATDTTHSPTHTYSMNGIYTVCLIAMNACLSDTFYLQVSITIGLHPKDKAWNCILFPNPSSGVFTLTLDGIPDQEINYTLISVTGQVVNRGVVIFQDGRSHVTIPRLTPGSYFLKMIVDEKAIKMPLLISTAD